MSGTRDAPSDAERRRASLCARLNASPYYQLLGMIAESDRPGEARVTLPFGEKVLQVYGNIHGGALLSLADAAINIALATTFEGEERTATVDLSMQFIAPAGHHDVVALASVTHRGGRLGFGECVLRAGGRDVARAHGTCYVRRPKGSDPA
jgi:uncharacterized protein (TIGR00369 family)